MKQLICIKAGILSKITERHLVAHCVLNSVGCPPGGSKKPQMSFPKEGDMIRFAPYNSARWGTNLKCQLWRHGDELRDLGRNSSNRLRIS